MGRFLKTILRVDQSIGGPVGVSLGPLLSGCLTLLHVHHPGGTGAKVLVLPGLAVVLHLGHRVTSV